MASLKQLYYNYFIQNCVMCVICIKNHINCVLYKCCQQTNVSKTSAGRSDYTLEVALKKKEKKKENKMFVRVLFRQAVIMNILYHSNLMT